jgi:alkylated DNA repair dioxygenase AlkB
MFSQRSLFADAPLDVDQAPLMRTHLESCCWVDHAPAWLAGADVVFDELVDRLPFRQRDGIVMYDRVVTEPRLTYWWTVHGDGQPPLPVVRQAMDVLADRYHVPLDSIGYNLYRDGRDSVAWHGDRHRHTVRDPLVAILSVGAPRPFRVRPRGGGPSRRWDLGNGDLLVMGGSCQHHFEHCVPKVARAQPRLSITFRHAADFRDP